MGVMEKEIEAASVNMEAVEEPIEAKIDRELTALNKKIVGGDATTEERARYKRLQRERTDLMTATRLVVGRWYKQSDALA